MSPNQPTNPPISFPGPVGGSRHPDPDDLPLYAMHLLTGEEAAVITHHLERCDECRDELARIPSLRDLQFAQSLDYPTVEVRVDRELAGKSHLTVADVSRSLVEATSSSRFVVPVFCESPGNVISNGKPVRKVTIPPTCQPPSSASTGALQLPPNDFPRPNGSS